MTLRSLLCVLAGVGLLGVAVTTGQRAAGPDDRGGAGLTDVATVPPPGLPDADAPSPPCAPGAGTPPQGNPDLLSEMLEFETRFDELARAMQRGDDPRYLFAAVALRWGGDATARLATLDRALRGAPNEPLILREILDVCSSQPPPDACAGRDLVAQLRALDGSNADTWLRTAFVSQDSARMLADLQAAGSAPRFDVRFVDTVLILEDALAAHAAMDYRQRVMAAIGVTATRVPDFGPLTLECNARSAASPLWLQACLDVARRLEQDAGSLLYAAIGLDLQRRLYLQSGDEAEAGQVSARQQSLRDLQRRFSDTGAAHLLERDTALLSDYLDTWAAQGEQAALQLVIDTRQRRMREDVTDRCVSDSGS